MLLDFIQIWINENDKFLKDRFGGASMTENQWKAAKAALEKIGYKVEASEFKPAVNK